MRPSTALSVCTTVYLTMAAALVAQTPARTVWDGVFTAAQAERGQAQYAASCARCHGGSLEGGMGASLVGAAFWNKWREQSVGDLLDYVSKNMPMGQTSITALSPPVYADIVSFLLRSNDLPAGPAELSAARVTAVRIVPKDGGTGELPSGTLARVVGCLAPDGAGWRVIKAGTPERMKSIEGGVPPVTAGGERAYPLKFVLQPLERFTGQRVSVVGLLLGDGGADGVNVSTVTSVAPTCD
jgi:mono/diheme cytochrome c family protein